MRGKRTRQFSNPKVCPECGYRDYFPHWGCGHCGLGNPYHDYHVDLGPTAELVPEPAARALAEPDK